MVKNERAYNTEGTENVPKPEVSGAEAIVDSTACQLVTDTSRDPMAPYNRHNTTGEPREDEEHEAVVHGLLAIIAAGDGVDVGTNGGHHNDTVDAQRNDRKQDILQKASVRLQFADRLTGCGGSRIRHLGRTDVAIAIRAGHGSFRDLGSTSGTDTHT